MDKRFLKAFGIESGRLLEQMKTSVAGLAETGDNSSPHREDIRLAALKIADAARIAASDEIRVLSEKLAALCSESPTGEHGAASPHAAIELGIDAVGDFIAAVCAEKPPPPLEPLLQKLSPAAVSSLKPEEPSIAAPPPETTKKTFDKQKIKERILTVFATEYKEHVEQIRGFLGSSQQEQKAIINEAYRSAHSMKGAARAVDLKVVEVLAHRIESVFSRIQADTITLDKVVTALLLKVLDAIEDYVTSYFKGETTSSPELLIQQLDDLLGEQSTPDIQPAAEGELLSAPVQEKTFLRVEADSLDQLQVSCGQLATLTHRDKELTDDILAFTKNLDSFARENNQLIKDLRRNFPRFESDPQFAALARFTNWIKNGTTSLERKGRSVYLKQSKLRKDTSLVVDKIMADISTARMIPAQNDYQMLRKMVRDLARDEGKNIEVVFTGLEQKADRLVLQQLKDPLMHLLRNAISHGIETPAERLKAGKPHEATIRLDIEVLKNTLEISVSDDGKGLAQDEILHTAIKRKLISPEQASQLSPAQVTELILQPGFSTAPMITDLSGRGMGLSVVKNGVDRLQGDIIITTSPLHGTRFLLSVPLTIMTLRVLLVKHNKQVFGVPVSYIERLMRIKTDQVNTIEGKTVIYDGKVPIPLTSLNELLSQHENFPVSDSQVSVLLIASKNEQLAIAVDTILAERDVLVKELPEAIRSDLFQNGFALSDDSVCLILNPSELLRGHHKTTHKRIVFTADESKDVTIANRILIVDDSITTRTLEKTILEAHGYTVFVAVDGREALQTLMTIDVDLVITDVDMPRMTGFELIREMKNHDTLKLLPVIIVTSMEKTSDKEQGLKLGADAYIVKQKFEQQDLLDTIRQIL